MTHTLKDFDYVVDQTVAIEVNVLKYKLSVAQLLMVLLDNVLELFLLFNILLFFLLNNA